jgi:hypothetical protein
LETTPNDGIPREYVWVWDPRENSMRIVDVAERRESAEGDDFGERVEMGRRRVVVWLSSSSRLRPKNVGGWAPAVS